MALPDQAIVEFIEIYKKEIGETLNMPEARVRAQKFFDFCKVITKPIQNSDKSVVGISKAKDAKLSTGK
ncbi:MAG: hypothetical protein ACOZAO_03850 [Patescibacteria group bacterium]